MFAYRPSNHIPIVIFTFSSNKAKTNLIHILIKTSKAARRLSEALRERDEDLKKDYVCIVNGIVANDGICNTILF